MIIGALTAVSLRLTRSDMIQGLVVCLAALSFVLAVRWPGVLSLSNEAWFALAPVRSSLLAVGAAAYGAAAGLSRSDRWTTLGALLAACLITMPFEIASYPNLDAAWAFTVPLLTTTGYFGLGLWLGAAAGRLRIGGVLPLLVLLLFGLVVWIDYLAGVNLINPWQAAVEASARYLGVITVLSALTLLSLVPPLWRSRGSARPSGDSR